jgi:hypothetical protein
MSRDENFLAGLGPWQSACNLAGNPKGDARLKLSRPLAARFGPCGRPLLLQLPLAPKPDTLRDNMHENREISSTLSSIEEGRSAKALNRNADMRVLEKSDCAVVPVNQPNKEAEASAEVGEGREQMKENIAQSRMHPTLSGKGMFHGLDGVRNAAKERRQERFTSSFHHLSVDLLHESFTRSGVPALPVSPSYVHQVSLVDAHPPLNIQTILSESAGPNCSGNRRPIPVALNFHKTPFSVNMICLRLILSASRFPSGNDRQKNNRKNKGNGSSGFPLRMTEGTARAFGRRGGIAGLLSGRNFRDRGRGH